MKKLKKLLAFLLVGVLVILSVLVTATPVFAAVETLRPNAVGDETGIDSTTEGTHWQAVDEAVADGDATYVQQTDGWGRDLYNLPAHAGTGTVNSVTVYYTARYTAADTHNTRALIRTGGTTYEGDKQLVPIAYTERSEEWTQNPFTGVAWTWDDIDALQIGVSLRGGGVDAVRCTQVYAVVDYTPATAPAITLDAATYVALTTARLNSTVIDGGNEACDVRFGYGTTTQANVAAYDIQTAWVEDTYTTGQHPYVDIDTLNSNDQYFFRAAIRNAHSTVESGELNFTTENAVSAPSLFTAYPEDDRVVLSWTIGVGASAVMVRFKEGAYPVDETDGTEVYSGVLSDCAHENLDSGQTYYYSAWGYSGATFSGASADILATTLGDIIVTAPSVPNEPALWYQTPEYGELSALPLYAEMNDFADALAMPRATVWMLSGLLFCVVAGVIVFAFTGGLSATLITVATAMLIDVFLLPLLPLWMVVFSIIFFLGAYSTSRGGV